MGLISDGTTIFDAGSMAAGLGGSMTFIKKLTASSSSTAVTSFLLISVFVTISFKISALEYFFWIAGDFLFDAEFVFLLGAAFLDDFLTAMPISFLEQW